MLSDLNAFNPNSSLRFLGNDGVYVSKYELSNRLTAYCRQNAKIDKVRCGQQLQRRQMRVILRDNHGVIEVLMQPFLNFFQSTEINAPISFV